MAGIYFHIPFCHQACHYCDFHFSTVRGAEQRMMHAMILELVQRATEANLDSVETIYFGGGTPSLLPPEMIAGLMESVRSQFKIDKLAEITLEANPEDLTIENLEAWKSMGINRLSIGIQSFHDVDLRYMNRNHSGEDALSAVRRARDAGFEKLTADLIYGTPTMDDEAWQQNLEWLAEQELFHFSAYSLTVEPRTALHHLVTSRAVTPPEEDRSARQFHLLMQWARSHGFEQYEISNFAREESYSRHNTAYWKGIPYIGIGPSAHSFSGDCRRWNIRNNHEYMQSVFEGRDFFEKEILTKEQRYNEYIMTSLRTKWGVSRSRIAADFGSEFVALFDKEIMGLPAASWLSDHNGVVVLTDEGKLFADYIASCLFA